MFTGDGEGGSGDFLMAALHAIGLASQPSSHRADDGLTLHDAWIVATARCAPPGNKPTPEEIANCAVHLEAEVRALPRARVFVALGRIAFDACWRLLGAAGASRRRPRPAFAHGAAFRLDGGRAIVASYHPSRQNTHTGRLTPAMLRAVFRTARRLADR
jgi:uracil-DNA glycosylase family 4